MSSCVTSCQSDGPSTSPSALRSSSSPVIVRMAAYPAVSVAGPLLLTDAPHLLYRGFFAPPDSIRSPDGIPVNALLGSVNQTLWCVERWKPRAVVKCFGQEAADYRVELFPPYHAHRPPMPEALAAQWDRAPAFYEALGWQVQTSPDHEADDLMPSLARAEEQAGGTALILTGDRDMFQSVTDKIHVLMQRARQQGPDEMGPAEVTERYGIPPELVPDFIALRGDPSDGLPGAKGIGEKTAADLLKRHDSLESALAAWSRERPPRVAGALRDQADELRTFKDIATLRTLDVELPPDTDTDFEGGARAARDRGMEQLAGRLEKAAGPA